MGHLSGALYLRTADLSGFFVFTAESQRHAENAEQRGATEVSTDGGPSIAFQPEASFDRQPLIARAGLATRFACVLAHC